MGVAVTPVNINDGDPVTADTLRTFINNVNLVALGDTSSGVTVGDSSLAILFQKQIMVKFITTL